VSLKQAVTTLQPDLASHVTNKLHCLIEQDSRLAHYCILHYFGVWGYFWGYLAAQNLTSREHTVQQ